MNDDHFFGSLTAVLADAVILLRRTAIRPAGFEGGSP
jgi:hypothetical protein